MILWNVAKKKIEARYDGKIFEFAPDEKKKIAHPDIVNHLIFKLKDKGLLAIEESDAGKPAEKEAVVGALKARLKTVDRIVKNFRTMNKEREKSGLSSDFPDDVVVEAVEESQELMDRIKEIEGDKIRQVEKYLKEDKVAETTKKIMASESVIKNVGEPI